MAKLTFCGRVPRGAGDGQGVEPGRGDADDPPGEVEDRTAAVSRLHGRGHLEDPAVVARTGERAEADGRHSRASRWASAICDEDMRVAM